MGDPRWPRNSVELDVWLRLYCANAAHLDGGTSLARHIADVTDDDMVEWRKRFDAIESGE